MIVAASVMVKYNRSKLNNSTISGIKQLYNVETKLYE